MEALGGFLSVGTQMKVERPRKACAVTPCIDIDGPTVLLDDGAFRRVATVEEWRDCADRVLSIWDSGEILSGFGEFLENNKELVPSAYNRDWWAADLVAALGHPEQPVGFAELLGLDRTELPPGMPFNGAIERGGESALDRSWRQRNWFLYLRDMEVEWESARAMNLEYGTAVPPPWNLWWSDMPMSCAPSSMEEPTSASMTVGANDIGMSDHHKFHGGGTAVPYSRFMARADSHSTSMSRRYRNQFRWRQLRSSALSPPRSMAPLKGISGGSSVLSKPSI
jgi:hypothetical protein